MAVVRSGFDLTKFSPMPILTVVDPFGIVDVYHLPCHPFVSCNSKPRKRRLGSSIRTAETGSSSSLTATCRDLRRPLLIMNVLYFFVHITYLYNLVEALTSLLLDNGAGRFPLQLLPWKTSSTIILSKAAIFSKTQNATGRTFRAGPLEFGYQRRLIKACGLASRLRYL